jgi:hypothetical protein
VLSISAGGAPRTGAARTATGERARPLPLALNTAPGLVGDGAQPASALNTAPTCRTACQVRVANWRRTRVVAKVHRVVTKVLREAFHSRIGQGLLRETTATERRPERHRGMLGVEVGEVGS